MFYGMMISCGFAWSVISLDYPQPVPGKRCSFRSRSEQIVTASCRHQLKALPHSSRTAGHSSAGFDRNSQAETEIGFGLLARSQVQAAEGALLVRPGLW